MAKGDVRASLLLPRAPESEVTARCLVIGWDGADPATIAAMLESGDLPVLGALRAAGGLRLLDSLPGLGDDAHWATFSTGVGPGTHGRFHHEQYNPSVGEVSSIGRSLMTTPPFWESLARAGAKVTTLDVPKSPLANADCCRQLADWMPHGEDDQIIAGSPPSVVDHAGRHCRRSGSATAIASSVVVNRRRCSTP